MATFSFGFSTTATNNTTTGTGQKPAAFTLGTQATSNTAKTGTTPSFSFGGAPTGTTPSFSFTSGTTTTTTTTGSTTPSFSFGGTTTTTTATTTTGTTPSFSFGGTTSTTKTTPSFSFGTSTTQQQQITPTQDSSQVAVRIQSIIEQINGGPFDRFKFAFYNRGDPFKYRKPDKMSEMMWRDAQIRNPDPDRLVPVLAVGFKDLQTRRELQTKQRQEQEELITKIAANIEEQQYKQQLFEERLVEYRKTIAHNILRILKMLGRVECLRRKGQPLNRNEEHLFSQLEKMKDEIVKPGQYNNRLLDLVSNVKSESESNDLVEYPSLDEDTIEKVQDILGVYVKALTSIIKEVDEDSKALTIIEKSFRESVTESTKK